MLLYARYASRLWRSVEKVVDGVDLLVGRQTVEKDIDKVIPMSTAIKTAKSGQGAGM